MSSTSNARLNVVVLTGGSTPERNVALAGAGQVALALREAGHNVTTLDTARGPLSEADERERLSRAVGAQPPSKRRLEQLAEEEELPGLLRTPAVAAADVLFLVLHGRQGEGGQVQALLELSGLTYTGSDAAASAVAMDKVLSKRLFRDAGIDTPAWQVWPVAAEALECLGLPLVVKPSRVGSTVGLSVIDELDELDRAVGDAMLWDRAVLIEEFVGGRELTVGVLQRGDDLEALSVGEIIPTGAIFDYHNKYTPGIAQEIFPADIPDTTRTELQATALAAHRVLGLRDLSRVDFRLRPDGRASCLEVNTLPGMTKTSLLPQSAAASGISFVELCDRIVRSAVERCD